MVNCDLYGSKDYEVVLVESGIDIVKCKKCGLIYTKRPSETIFERSESAEDIFRETEMKKSVYNKVLNQIKIKEHGKLLDIGSRVGNFMILAKNKGFDTVGIEPSKKICFILPK